MNDQSDITIRTSGDDDELALARLAQRDSSPALDGPALVAEVAGSMRAAISLRDGRLIADPFHRTSELVEMLRIRAQSLAGSASGAQSRGWRMTGLRLALASSRRRTGVV